MSLETIPELRSLFEVALNQYKSQAGVNLLEHQLTLSLINCDDPDSVIAVLQEKAEEFSKFRGDDGKVTKWLKRTVYVLHTLSTSGVLGEGIGLPFPPAKAIFAGIGILLAAIKDVSSSYDALIDLFESIENFLRRLDIYTKIPCTTAITEIIIKILIELLSTLSLATQQIKQGRLKKFGKKLLGENDVEAVLQRLDRLTQEEARATAAQALQVVYGLVKDLNVVMNDGKAASDNIHQTLVLMQQIASDLNKSKRDQFQESFRRWLSPPDPSINDNFAWDAHHEGTASWFIQGDTFREWKLSGSLLWIHGNPGSGKSVLCSAITQDIKRMRDAGLASMAFFYFDFKDTSKQSARALLTSLLIQRSAQSDACCDILSGLYSAHEAGSKQPSDDVLRDCLRDMLATSGQGPLFIVVDALDECPQSTGTPSPRERVLDLVEWLANLHYSHLHLCVTSRPEADIQVVLETLAPHTVSLHSESGQIEDIKNYISFFIKTNASTRKWREQDQELVISNLSQQAGGMFRWVSCQMDKLRRCLPQRIRRALDELPTTLDETYERTLLDIDEEKWAFAHRLFQCVTVASRPLRVEELAEFLAIDFDEGSARFETDWRPEDARSAVLSTCSSLISIVNVDDAPVVQYSHFSVKEFLTSTRIARGRLSRYYIPSEPAHMIVARGCLSLLLQLDNHVTRSSIKTLPLARYAAQYWVDHAKAENVSSHLEHEMKQLFDPDRPHFAAWAWIYNIDLDRREESMNLENPYPPAVTPLYYSILCGFKDMAEWLVTTCFQDVDARSRSNQTALHAASREGFLKIAELLLEHGANVKDRDIFGWTPLHWASSTGHVEVCRLLLQCGADIDAKDNGHRTPLHFAPEERLEVAQLLLESNADSNPWCGQTENATPLHGALQQGHLGLVQLLLKHGVDLNAQNNAGDSLLHIAAKECQLGVLQQLLELGADVHLRNNHDQTPFQAVSQRRDFMLREDSIKFEVELQKEKHEIEQLLLKHGASRV